MAHNSGRTSGNNFGSLYECPHYKRRAILVTPCCDKLYMCHICHDETESHFLSRRSVKELICTICSTQQKIQAQCSKCRIRFGKYVCLVCNLFDDEDKQQFHCKECGICRVGGRSNYFHCKVCNLCLSINLQINGHRCVENVSRCNCSICLEDIHSSRKPLHVPKCGHVLHQSCYDDLIKCGFSVCPTCQNKYG